MKGNTIGLEALIINGEKFLLQNHITSLHGQKKKLKVKW